MADNQSSDQPLQELKHEAVSGAPMIFTVCFAVMSIYLGIILYTSPGKVDHGHSYEKSDSKKAEKH